MDKLARETLILKLEDQYRQVVEAQIATAQARQVVHDAAIQFHVLVEEAKRMLRDG